MNILVISNTYAKGKSPEGTHVNKQIESLITIGIHIKKIVKNRNEIFGYIPFIIRNFYYLFFYNSYDIVHAHYGFHSALFAAIIKKTPLIITFHRGDALNEPYRNKIYFKLQKFVISRADHIIAVSNEIKNALIKNLGAQENKISIIPCGVDMNLFIPLDKQEQRKKLGISDNSKIILFVGGFSHRKGIDILLACAKQIQEANFIFVGEGELKTDCQNCWVVGSRSNDKLPEWYAASDIFFLPSRSEGTPVVLLEALACGIPVVAAKVGGVSDLIRNGETGYLVELEDVSMMEKRLRELLGNPEKAVQIGREGKNFVIENYDSRKIAERIKKVYEMILDEKQ